MPPPTRMLARGSRTRTVLSRRQLEPTLKAVDTMSMAFLKSKTPTPTMDGRRHKRRSGNLVPAAFVSFGRSKELVAETVDPIKKLSFVLILDIVGLTQLP